VPIVGRIVWADDGEEQVETALGWTGRDEYVRMSDRRYQLKAVWARHRRCHMTMTVDECRMTRARIRDEFIAHDIQRSTATPDALTRTRRPASSLGAGRLARFAAPPRADAVASPALAVGTHSTLCRYFAGAAAGGGGHPPYRPHQRPRPTFGGSAPLLFRHF
jgi:hypothetical protein